jgi:Secretion system C-terminal sorting domain
MKKVYLSILGITVLGSSFAQRNYESQQAKTFVTAESTSAKNKPALTAEKTAGTPFWTDGFTDPTTWVIDNSGQTAPTFGWDIGATEASWWTSAVINSTSDGNFAELSNGNPTLSPGTQALDVTYTLTSSAAIPVPSDQVSLSFLQYGARFNDAQEVYISTDGTNWVLVGDNSDQPVLSSTGGAAYTNPTLKTVNLATAIAGATSIWIRFSWTTGYPGSATNPNVWVTYGWMIDDVILSTNSTDDITENSVMWGTQGSWGGVLPYYQIPTTQVQPIDFGGIITNNGSNDQADVVFHATATGYTGLSLPSPIIAGASDTIWVANQLTPAATLASTTVSFLSDMTATDDNMLDNALAPSVTFAVTDHTYARDAGAKTGTTDNGGLAFEVGNIFDVFAEQTVYSVDITLDNTASTGAQVRAKIYDATSGNFDVADLIAETDDHYVVSSDKGNNLSLEIPGGALLLAGTSYLAVIHADGGTAPDIVLQTAGTSVPQTCFYQDDALTWFYTTETPKIRLNFLNSSGLNELTNTAGLSVYPNPSACQANVSFSLKNETEVVISLTDLTGKTVFTNNLGTLTTGAHKTTINTDVLSNGVYMVNFVANGVLSTQKLIVRK